MVVVPAVEMLDEEGFRARRGKVIEAGQRNRQEAITALVRPFAEDPHGKLPCSAEKRARIDPGRDRLAAERKYPKVTTDELRLDHGAALVAGKKCDRLSKVLDESV